MNKLKYIASEKLEQSKQENKIGCKVYDIEEARVYPNRPQPPPIRLIREGTLGTCPRCGSTEIRRFLLFGKKKCIQPECQLSTWWHTDSELKRNF